MALWLFGIGMDWKIEGKERKGKREEVEEK